MFYGVIVCRTCSCKEVRAHRAHNLCHVILPNRFKIGALRSSIYLFILMCRIRTELSE